MRGADAVMHPESILCPNVVCITQSTSISMDYSRAKVAMTILALHTFRRPATGLSQPRAAKVCMAARLSRPVGWQANRYTGALGAAAVDAAGDAGAPAGLREFVSWSLTGAVSSV